MQRKKVLGSTQTGNENHIVRAPMPGKIIDVIVRENTEVIRGEALVILEAMKMQNEIQSLVNGTVTRIGVKPGQNVMKDDILAEIYRQIAETGLRPVSVSCICTNRGKIIWLPGHSSALPPGNSRICRQIQSQPSHQDCADNVSSGRS